MERLSVLANVIFKVETAASRMKSLYYSESLAGLAKFEKWMKVDVYTMEYGTSVVSEI